MKIIEKNEVARCGPFVVLEGDIEVDHQEATCCWVERDGKVVSAFGDIDYANIRARMLNAMSTTAGAVLPPDLTGVIEIVERDDPYTVLAGRFGEVVYWVVNGSGDAISDWGGDLSFARDFIREKRASRARTGP